MNIKNQAVNILTLVISHPAHHTRIYTGGRRGILTWEWVAECRVDVKESNLPDWTRRNALNRILNQRKPVGSVHPASFWPSVVTHGARAVHGALLTGGRIYQPKDRQDFSMKFKPNQTRTYDREGFKRRAACLCFKNEREDEVRRYYLNQTWCSDEKSVYRALHLSPSQTNRYLKNIYCVYKSYKSGVTWCHSVFNLLDAKKGPQNINNLVNPILKF